MTIGRVPPGASADDAEVAAAFHPRSYRPRVDLFGDLDEHFAANWVTHVGRLLGRSQLDRRRRLLVLVGQYTMRGDLAALAETLEAALDNGVDCRELIEVVLQCYVYAGGGRVADAAAVTRRVLEERGLLEEAKRRQPPLDVATAGRSLEEERGSWSDADRSDPRTEEFIERYGWHGFSTGLAKRPGHHINLVATLDALDPGFLQIWLDAIYQNMYSRHVLDDATRLLCTVADCFAVGETHQATRHMRGALRAGIRPQELLEVIFQTCTIVGHPHMLPLAIDDLVSVLIDEGRLSELVAEDKIPQLTRLVSARRARRAGVVDALDPHMGAVS